MTGDSAIRDAVNIFGIVAMFSFLVGGDVEDDGVDVSDVERDEVEK